MRSMEERFWSKVQKTKGCWEWTANLHHCDNPLCVRPDHLFLGTVTDNMLDMYSKDRRSTKGSKNGRAMIDEHKVQAIRILACEYKQRDVARHFGVSESIVSHIVRGRTWSHLPPKAIK